MANQLMITRVEYSYKAGFTMVEVEQLPLNYPTKSLPPFELGHVSSVLRQARTLKNG